MAYDPGAIDATLAAAVGDEPQLIAELREAFLDGVRRGLDNLERAFGGEIYPYWTDRYLPLVDERL